MYKKTTLIILITLFSITQVFSQEEGGKQDKEIEMLLGADCGLAFVQDRISPALHAALGVNFNDNLKINIVAQGVFFFSTRDDDSRKRNDEAYYGLEVQWPGFLDLGPSTEGLWGGIGVSYCPKPFIDLHEKKPIKVYSVVDFGTISIATEYVWSDFWYPGISVRFGF